MGLHASGKFFHEEAIPAEQTERRVGEISLEQTPGYN